jgi:hypothetical protein
MSDGAAKAGSNGACMWGFVGAASFAAVRGVWGLVAGDDEDSRFAAEQTRRLEMKSMEDEISFISGVTRRCWAACVEGAGESVVGGEEQVPLNFSVGPVPSCPKR